MKWFCIAALVVILVAPARAAFTFYPLTNGVTYTNAMFMELWSGMVERCWAANITSGLDYVRTYQVFTGYSNDTYKVTNVVDGTTHVYDRVNQWPTYAPLTVTNQWEPFTYTNAGTVYTATPSIREQDFQTLDARLFAFMQSDSFIDDTVAATDGTFNAIFLTNEIGVLGSLAAFNTTGLFARLEIGLVTSSVNSAGITNWNAYFTDFAPAESGSVFAVWESVNAITNYEIVLSGFADTNLNGRYAFIGDRCDDSGFDFAFHEYSAGGTPRIGAYFAYCTNGSVDYTFTYSEGQYLELQPSGVFDLAASGQYYFNNTFGLGPWRGWPTNDAGIGSATNLTCGFRRLRSQTHDYNVNVPTPEARYVSGATDGTFSVSVQIQGSAVNASGIVTGNQSEVVALSGAVAVTNPLTRRWITITNAIVTGTATQGDTFVVCYVQPFAQASSASSYQFQYYHYNERAKFIDALRWTHAYGFPETVLHQGSTSGYVYGFGETCEWANAKSQAETTTTNIMPSPLSPQVTKHTGGTLEGSDTCAGEVAYMASWITSWSYDLVTNFSTNLSKTVDTYAEVNAVGTYDDNGQGLGATGRLRRAVSSLLFGGVLSNNYGDTAQTIGTWCDQPDTTNTTKNRGSTMDTLIERVTKWTFNYVLP